MRRRFEKRVYIALPEASARSRMFRMNLGIDLLLNFFIKLKQDMMCVIDQ